MYVKNVLAPFNAILQPWFLYEISLFWKIQNICYRVEHCVCARARTFLSPRFCIPLCVCHQWELVQEAELNALCHWVLAYYILQVISASGQCWNWVLSCVLFRTPRPFLPFFIWLFKWLLCRQSMKVEMFLELLMQHSDVLLFRE